MTFTCNERRRQILRELPFHDPIGAHVPTCDPDGKLYAAKQCRTASDVCWCVNAHGKEIPGSSASSPAECSQVQRGNIEGPQQVERRTEENSSSSSVTSSPSTLRGSFNSGNDGGFSSFPDNQGQRPTEIPLLPQQNNFPPASNGFAQPPIQNSNFFGAFTTPSVLERGGGGTDVSRKEASACSIFRAGICHQSAQQSLDSSSSLQHHCNCDDDCFGRQKCCLEMDGRRCADPIRGPSNQPSTGILGLGLQCGGFEQYSPCFNPCQPSCASLNQPPCVQQFGCQPGCACQPGYVRSNSDPRSPCVLPSQCGIFTGSTVGTLGGIVPGDACNDPRKQYNLCGTACPIGCNNQANPQGLCDTRCVSGCFCRPPYIFQNSGLWQTSQCVLPQECPATTGFIGSPGGSCPDIQKEFRSCGSACPPGCNNLTPNVCSLQCVANCFCRAPYILEDANNINSRCVLPQQCPNTGISLIGATSQFSGTCSDLRKEYSTCGTSCAKSCNNLNPICTSSCTAGCFCREPYVLADQFNPNARCVLPSECTSSTLCTDPNKEYLTCGSSCPIGCGNLNPLTCTPCASGCFCRAGYVFEDSINWRNSRCILASQCGGFFGGTTSSFGGITGGGLFRGAVSSTCPSSSIDTPGRFCNRDEECPADQKCCRPPNSFGVTVSNRCLCPDPHATWSSCGSECSEYCGQSSAPKCSQTCNPGCHCAAGYIKLRNDMSSPCVLRSQCDIATPAAARDITPLTTVSASNASSLERAAVASIYGPGGKITGDMRFTDEGNGVRITGTLKGLPAGEHGLIIHEFGDVSFGCANVGAPFDPDNLTTGLLGNIQATEGQENSSVSILNEKVTLTGTMSIVGRAIAVHEKKIDIVSKLSDGGAGAVIACGAVGMTG
uniref:Thyroglobulin type-1 domain-containing protein n=1 Tax=Plectus sambesii TaxID=2011161 RepID=A0A914VTS1_9BILA